MTPKCITIGTVLVALMGSTVLGAQRAEMPQRPLSPAAKSAEAVLSTADDQPDPTWSGEQRKSLGRATSASVAPGIAVGYTYYDKQSNGTIGRMVDWGVDPDDGFQVHFCWTYLATEVQENRKYAYNQYSAQSDAMLGLSGVQPDGEYAGYVGLDVSSEGRACIGGHNNQGGGYQSHFYWWSPGFGHWQDNCRLPDSVSAAGTGQDWHTDSLKSAIWPKFRYQDIPGQDHVLHVFTQVSEPGAGDDQAIIYFRKVGEAQTGVWDYPPYVVDTVHDIAQDVACSNIDGKVALVWFANLPVPGDCDTCSSHGYWPFSQMDNDVYYQISNDYGATWQPRVNVTKNVDGEAGYRPYTDASALIDSDDNLHIAWSARVWPADANMGGAAGQLAGRIFHWGENLGLGGFDGNGDAVITTAGNLEWNQTTCNGGSWNLNGCKMSVSECDGKLYCLWTQFNDIPNGIEDDCHNRAIAGTSKSGSANGELYVAVSADGGMTWDWPRNLTNTRTPGCDSVGGAGGRCQSDVWPSMARFGTNHAVGSNVVIVDPSSGYAGDWFVDVQYIDDADPGSMISDEGGPTQNDVRWFRLACVEPVEYGTFEPSWVAIGWPAWTQHGLPFDTQLVITNTGNINTDFAFTLEEDPGAFTGWLTISSELQGSVTVPSGLDNTITGTVTINTGGLVNTPGTVVHLGGRLIAVGNQTTNPDTLPINCWVMDSLQLPVWDTITTGCLALTVSNHGNAGNQGIGKVNMDFFDYGDCDDMEPPEDTIPGDATIYLNDASPVICWTDQFDTVRCNWSIYGDGFPSERGFVPLSSVPPIDMGAFELYQSEFTTVDSAVGIKKLWIAPKGQSDSCRFLVQVLKVSSADGGSHAGLNIGEFVDWDIPSDTLVRNRSASEPSQRLIYQQGREYNQDDPIECQDNNDRYGGIALLEIIEIDGSDTTSSAEPYGAYTADNSTYVYPNGRPVAAQVDSMMTENEGYVMSGSIDADLHSVMTYLHDQTVSPTQTAIVFSCLISGRLGYADFIAATAACHQWYDDHLRPPTVTCCKGLRGNVCSGPDSDLSIVDLVCLVDCMFFGQCFDFECWAEVNIDGSGPINGDEDSQADLDISDLVHLVDYMFTGGPPPAPCP